MRWCRIDADLTPRRSKPRMPEAQVFSHFADEITRQPFP